jgi:uncharacterized protein
LPYRLSGKAKNELRILLVTSRDTGRWVVPKGNPIFGLPAHSAAAMEAEEEAGVRGTVDKQPIGSFHYFKWRDERTYDVADVTLYALRVRRELAKWKEQGERKRRWMTRDEATEMVDEPELRSLIRSAILL